MQHDLTAGGNRWYRYRPLQEQPKHCCRNIDQALRTGQQKEARVKRMC